jgi:hypothetical protein
MIMLLLLLMLMLLLRTVNPWFIRTQIQRRNLVPTRPWMTRLGQQPSSLEPADEDRNSMVNAHLDPPSSTNHKRSDGDQSSTSSPNKRVGNVGGCDGVTEISDSGIIEWSPLPPPPPNNDFAFQQQKTSIAFAHPYFYQFGGIMASREPELYWKLVAKEADYYKKARDLTFGESTVRSVFQRPVEEWKFLFEQVGINLERVVPYFMRGACVEDVLAERRIIPLSNPEEVQRFEEKCVSLSIMHSLFVRQPFYDRIIPVAYVSGSRGSGKTCFALVYASDVDYQGLPKAAKRATVYFQLPPTIAILLRVRQNAEENCDLLVSWIKVKIQEECRVALTKQLDMHLSVVVDEAGASEWNGFFEVKENISRLIEKLRPLAKSLFLVVCGTSGPPGTGSSAPRNPVFRMPPWPSDELVRVFRKI